MFSLEDVDLLETSYIDRGRWRLRADRKYTHVVVAERMLGRPIIHPQDHVHHVDTNKLNFSRSNLMVLAPWAHHVLHRLLTYREDGVNPHTHSWCADGQHYAPRRLFATAKSRWNDLQARCKVCHWGLDRRNRSGK